MNQRLADDFSGTDLSASNVVWEVRFHVSAAEPQGDTTMSGKRVLGWFAPRSGLGLFSLLCAAHAVCAGPPAIVSLTPDSGTGTLVTFQAVYSDPNGASDLNEILLQVNTIQSSANACYVYYQPKGNHLYLATDAGNVWMSPALTPGTAGTASNTQCELDAGSSSVSTSGNDLTLNVALTFNSTVIGSRNVYLYAAGLSGQNSGWVKEGTWTPTTSAGPPAIVSLSPNEGAGSSVVFQAIYSDPNGAADLSEALLQINTVQSSGNACYVYYQPKGNHLYLASNAGSAWMTPVLTPGVAGTGSNGQCTLNAGLSSFSTAGNELILNIALTFNSTFVGPRNVYLYAAGLSGQYSGWFKEGTWTPGTSAGPPAIVSLSQNAGTVSSVTFQAVYSDPNGAGDLNEILLQMNVVQISARACYVYYQPQGSHLYLADDSGEIWMTPALTPGSAGTASNSQCTLNAGSSSVAVVGNDLTLTVALTFSSTWLGARNVYLYAAGMSRQNSGWVKEGTWTHPSAGPPTVVSLSPDGGIGTSVTFTAVYSDPNGVGDLSTVSLLMGAYSNSCYVYYQPQGNRLYLRNDAGAWITPALTPGVAGTQSNSECTLNAGSSSVSTAGNNLTLIVALSFTPTTFVDAQAVSLDAQSYTGQDSYSVPMGDWTPNKTTLGPPSIVSFSKTTETGPLSGIQSQLQAVYLDPNGAYDLSEVLLLVNTSLSTANACYLKFLPSTNLLYLANDAGDAWMEVGSVAVGNSQCGLDFRIYGAFANWSVSGNYLTLNLNMYFNVPVGNVYLYAAGFSGQNSGWVNEGTWFLNSEGPPTIVSLSPNAGSGTSVTFQAVYADPNGQGDLSEEELLVNTIQSSANACYVNYQPKENLLYLANDAGDMDDAWAHARDARICFQQPMHARRRVQP